MRWLFHNPADANESQSRREVLARIDAWWSAFTAQTQALSDLFSRRQNWDLPNWMAENLQSIDPNLMWEFGPAVAGGKHRLVITPEWRHDLRPLVNAILDRAPRIAGWEFYPYRLPEDAAQARLAVEGRTGGHLDAWRVQPAVGQHRLIDLRFVRPEADRDPDNGFHTAFVATETLLGEELLNKWIGAIEVTERVDGPPRPVTPDRLKPTVVSLIESLREQLPEQPCLNWVDEAGWSMFELTPQQAEDYPHQLDLLVAKTPDAGRWRAARIPSRFCSERFSRHGEVFCYLKLDGSEGLDQEKFADKSEIEDALDEVLRPEGLGCQIGGGTGLRYSYIDLALVDVKSGIEAIVRRLRAGNVPHRSWIQFFDADLGAEWVGIYNDTPPPPLESD